jgi:hypothetical protein
MKTRLVIGQPLWFKGRNTGSKLRYISDIKTCHNKIYYNVSQEGLGKTAIRITMKKLLETYSFTDPKIS